MVAVATDPSTRYITTAWTSTASRGSTPARMRPVIAPGRNDDPDRLGGLDLGDQGGAQGAGARRGGRPACRLAQGQARLHLQALVAQLLHDRRAAQHRGGHRVADHQARRSAPACAPRGGRRPSPKTPPSVTRGGGGEGDASARGSRPGTSGRAAAGDVGGEGHHRGDPEPREHERAVGVDDDAEGDAHQQQLHQGPRRRPDEASRSRPRPPRSDESARATRHQDQRRGDAERADVTLRHRTPRHRRGRRARDGPDPAASVASSTRQSADARGLAEVVGHPQHRHALVDQARGPGAPGRAVAASSSAEVGSSIRSTSGPATRVRARQARWDSPPESSSAGRSRKPAASSARSRASAHVRVRSPASGARHAQVVAHRAAERRGLLEHHAHPPPVGQRVEPGEVRPAEAHRPVAGASSRLHRRRSVDFPDPDGPSTTVMPRSGTRRSTPRSTSPCGAATSTPSNSNSARVPATRR